MISMIKKYEKYKPSGVEWIGEIPEHWEVSKAKYYFQYTTGFTPPTGLAEFYNGDVTWVTIADMNQKVVTDSATKLSQAAIDKFNPALTLKDSLLYSFKLSVGKVAYAGEDLYTNEAIISILPNKEYDLRYFYYTLPEQLLQNASENIYGAKMLNQELIRNAAICFPPKSEQTAIASFLDEKTAQIDTLIEKKKKLIELLKEERTAIINYAVTKGINPDAKLKPSGIDWLGDPSTKLRASIPEHWELKKLKYVTEINSTSLTEKEDDDLEIEYIDISSVNEYGEIMQTASYFYSDAPSRARRIIHKGDTIISTVRTYLKAIAFIDVEKNNLICSTGFAVIRPSEKLEPNFLFYLSRSEKMVDRIMALSKGVSYPAIDSEDIKNLVGWFPDKDEQETIVQHIETRTARIDAAVSKIEKEIELLQEYRTALVSEVVTGKICVI